ncbi:MAG: hypothetical protein GTO55_07185 [Armatimonadetes bacterium]|nr:hypothetical protein [Armatimonadota bacterium]NIM24054.1 hypothetical protein [Armatimonadota bacterium]NIM67908.1 hypothetical protein [Armatimonadota bacterium]NIM76430.1 hypothetical protein [Armatimonadota bacterium]NIN06138.1 hypothetical protein [Armatimonadota bacterium]
MVRLVSIAVIGFGASAGLLYLLCLAEEEWLPQLQECLQQNIHDHWEDMLRAIRAIALAPLIIVFLGFANRALETHSIAAFWGIEITFCLVWAFTISHLAAAEERLVNHHKNSESVSLAMELTDAGTLWRVRRFAMAAFIVLFLIVTITFVASFIGYQWRVLAYLSFGLGEHASSFIVAILLAVLTGLIIYGERRVGQAAESLAHDLISIFPVPPFAPASAPDAQPVLSDQFLTLASARTDAMLALFPRIEQQAEQVYAVYKDGQEIDLRECLPRLVSQVIERLRERDHAAAKRYEDMVREIVEKARAEEKEARARKWEISIPPIGVPAAIGAE